MQKRQSHNKIPSETIQSNNYYIMPKSLRNSQTHSSSTHQQGQPSKKLSDDYSHLYHSEIQTNFQSQYRPQQSNLELQQALHYSEFNYQQIQRSYQQLYQTNIDLQHMYKQSEQENKQFQEEIKNLQNRILLKENEIKQATDNNTRYITDIAELKIQLQKLNSIIQKFNDENQNQKIYLNLSANKEQPISSRRDLNYQEESNNSGLGMISSSRGQNITLKQAENKFDQISNYQTQIRQYQKEITEKNQLISEQQQRIKSLTDFQKQLMSTSPKKSFLRESKISDMASPQQTPIVMQKTNESQMMSNKNLLNMIDDQQQKPDFAIHLTRQSDEFDVGPSVRSTITNTKTKSELRQIYKKISQSTIYTAGLYSSLLDYQFLSNNKLLSYSCSKDNLNN